MISSRSVAFYTLLALVPLYFINVLETSDAIANTALTGMLASARSERSPAACSPTGPAAGRC